MLDAAGSIAAAKAPSTPADFARGMTNFERAMLAYSFRARFKLSSFAGISLGSVTG